MPSRSSHIRHESWPPTQMRLQNSLEHEVDDKMDEDTDLSLIDDDPLTYFLTPAPALDDDDDDDVGMNDGDAAMMDFDFDAGIEDAKHPPPVVRSVSPSSLDGLALPPPPPQPPTPPRSPPARLSPDPESATDDDDEEDYIRYGTGRLHALGMPFTLKDFATLKARKAAKSKAAAAAAAATTTTTASLAPPTAPSALHAPTAISARGRPAARFGSSPPGSRYGGTARGRPRSFPSRRRSPHAWREPSPDVWSIEEEAEDEGEEAGVSSQMARSAAAVEADKKKPDVPEVVIVKPKKKVRFVLPVKEDR